MSTTGWTPRKLLFWGIAGHLCLLPAALRHNFVFGSQEVLGIQLSVLLGIGEGLCLLLFALLAGRAYVKAVQMAGELSPRFLLQAGILLALVAVLAPPFLSSDLFDYVSRGQVEAIGGQNPYVVTVEDLQSDPRMAEANELAQWPGFVMPYGPVTALLQWLVAAVAPGVWVGVYLFKLVFAACHVATGWLVFRALQGARGESAARTGLALYLWNPLLILEAAGSGHNDQLMAMCLAAMAAAVVYDKMAWATFAFGLAVLTKHGCAPIGPLLLALAWHRRQLAGFGIGLLATGALTAGLTLHYFTEPGSTEFLTKQVGVSASSVQSLLSTLIAPAAGTAVMIAGIVAVVGVMLFSLPRVRNAKSFGHCATLVMVLFVLLFMANFAPWYHLWWIPLVALWSAAAPQRALLWLGTLGPLSYLVYATTHSFALDHQLWQFALTLVIPAGLILWRFRELLARDPQPADEPAA